MASLALLHTADMHNRLSQAAARRLTELRREHKALLLDSGDAVGAGNVTLRRREPIIELMNEAGYAAMAVGNREYFFRKWGMIRKTRAARFAVLSANLRPLRGDLGHIQAWTIVTAAGGSRVGIFGLTPTMIGAGSRAEPFSDMRFMSWQAAVAGVVAALRDQVDWLVALSHLGKRYDRHLAELFSEIDVVLGGHSHRPAARIEQVAGRLLCWPAPYATEVVLIRASKLQGNNRYESRVIQLP